MSRVIYFNEENYLPTEDGKFKIELPLVEYGEGEINVFIHPKEFDIHPIITRTTHSTVVTVSVRIPMVITF